MKPPVEPNNEDCCNSGCNPCIFDVYEKRLVLYRKYLESGETLCESKNNAISELEYSAFIVLENVEVCDSHRLITFKKLISHCKSVVWWKPGDYFLLQYKNNNVAYSKAYTPLRMEHTEGCAFSIIVKRYENGLVSNYLCSLTKGDQTMWRGPYGSYELVPNTYNRIIMIAQGTGIVPFISIIESILNNDNDFTKIILIYCCHSINTVLLRDKLYSLQSYWNFTYEIYLPEDSLAKSMKYKEPVVRNKLNFRDLEKLKPFLVKDQFLLCGSKPFMNEYNVWLKNVNNISQQNIALF